MCTLYILLAFAHHERANNLYLINVTRYFLKVHEFIYYDNGDLVENFKIDVDHSLMKIQHQNKTQCKSI